MYILNAILVASGQVAVRIRNMLTESNRVTATLEVFDSAL
jgi:hypothetical protein